MSRRNEIITGAFVLGALTLLAIGAVWLSGESLRGDVRVLTARFEEVGQIKSGNTVTLRGVAVGKVSNVTLLDGLGVEVELRLREDVQLPPDPLVVLQPSSMFGEWQAAIVPRSARWAARVDTTALPPGRLPGVALADFAEISESSQEIANNLQALSARFELAFNEETARDLGRAVANFSRASDDLVAMLERQREEFVEFTADLAEAGDAVREAAEALDATLSRLAAATGEGELEAIFSNTREASASLREGSEQFRVTATDLNRWLVRADSAIDHVHQLLAGVNRGEGSLGLLARDAVLYENTAAALGELRALLDDLKQNPGKYFNLSIF